MLMVAFEDAEGDKLTLSVHFSNGYNHSVDVASAKNSVLNLTKLYPVAIELDLIILTTEASKCCQSVYQG